MRDKRTIDTYGQSILGVRQVLPKMIEIFEEYQISATFATVGFLFASNKEELIKHNPLKTPNYFDSNLSPYNGHFDLINDNEELDKYHYAAELIELLQKHPNQEIASHTYSHYYCLEKGQTKSEFKYDILAAIKIAKTKNISLKSLVFPRNQFNNEYLEVIRELGITSYRGNEKAWFQKASNAEETKLYKRAFRLIDAYINISGHNCYSLKEIAKKKPFDIPSSRFLRPYSLKLKRIEHLRSKRILKSMTYAAKNNLVYHLWWHPHNFSVFKNENFDFLSKILNHYTFLKSEYAFESLTMDNLSELLIKQNE